MVCAARSVSVVTTRAAAADKRQHDHLAAGLFVGGGDRSQHRRLAGPGGSDDRRHTTAAAGDLVDGGELVVAEHRITNRGDGERCPVLGGAGQHPLLSGLNGVRRVLGGAHVGVLGVVVDLEGDATWQ